MSTIRLPCVRFRRTISVVLKRFSATFCAVPAAMRVDPASTSVPLSSSTGQSAAARSGVSALLARPIPRAPHRRAVSSQAQVHAEPPLAASATTTSAGPSASASASARAARASSSTPSTLAISARSPPAIASTRREAGQPKVGQSSAPSWTASRPDAPAPAKTSRPSPSRRRAAAAVTARSSASRATSTASSPRALTGEQRREDLAGRTQVEIGRVGIDGLGRAAFAGRAHEVILPRRTVEGERASSGRLAPGDQSETVQGVAERAGTTDPRTARRTASSRRRQDRRRRAAATRTARARPAGRSVPPPRRAATMQARLPRPRPRRRAGRGARASSSEGPWSRTGHRTRRRRAARRAPPSGERRTGSRSRCQR